MSIHQQTEELRAELRSNTDPDERDQIRRELEEIRQEIELTKEDRTSIGSNNNSREARSLRSLFVVHHVKRFNAARPADGKLRMRGI